VTDDLTVADVIVTGTFTLLGVVVGLVGVRWVQTLGGVRCEVDWWGARGEGSVDSPGGVRILERQLGATFLNCKDVPVTVWDMQVVFYKGGQPLDEGERPHIASARRMPLEPVNLPPTRTHHDNDNRCP
jgi:hypothetical protein